MVHKILWLDDSKLLRKYLELYCHDPNFQIITTDTWEHAQKLLMEIVPDVFILDFHLQNDLTAIHCLEAAKTLGETVAAIPIILISSDADSLRQIYGTYPQVVACLEKPVQKDAIYTLLKAILDVHTQPKHPVPVAEPKAAETRRNILSFLTDYKVVQKLAQTEHHVIYKLYDSVRNQHVVLKLLPKALETKPEIIRRFLRGAELLSGIQHSNIVGLIGYGSHHDMYYMITEFVEGQSLSQYLSAQKVLELDLAIHLVMQISEGLSGLHHHDIVHADLTPNNIMILPSHQVKIIDFDFAETRQNLLQTKGDSSVIGTPQYMSPEQTMGTNIDPRTDIYALGCIFYEMLAGVPPLEGDFAEETIYLQRNCRPMALRQRNTKVKPSISNIVEKMLAKAPDDRFQTVDDFLEHLQRMQRFWKNPLTTKNVE